MKILHTSDWHFGQEFYSYDRTEEHESFLKQLRDIVSQEQPDVMVVSGDIYHNATPSNTVMRMFTDGLERVCRACPTMQVVVTAGNHDSSSRLEISRNIWSHLGVHVIGRIEKRDDMVDFDRHIIAIHDKQDNLCGYVVAIPHVFAHSFPIINPDTPREERMQMFFTVLGERLKEINTQHLPVVMMAHMAITGSDITGHDEIRGGMEYMDLSTINVDYDYLALGHIHCPQNINNNTRYCGSPIPVSFDERYPHSLTIVELDGKDSEPQLRTIHIDNPWPLKTIPTDAVPFDEALTLLTDYPNEEKAYIRLHVQLDDVAPHNANERAVQAIEGKCCRFCCFKWERTCDKGDENRTFTDIEQMKSQSPVDIASIYYSNKYGHPMDDNLKEMLTQVVREVESSEI